MGRVVIPGFRKIETSGGGEGGTSNYNDLTNKPSINNVPLVGNLNTVDLKLTDLTLTEEGVPAEAKTVGQKLEEHSTSLTALSEQLGNHTVKSDVPENAVFTDTVYDDTEVKEDVDTLKKETTVNLFKIPFGTTTFNGVTFINNGDGSISISGAIEHGASSYTTSVLVPVNIGQTYKVIGKFIGVYKKDNATKILQSGSAGDTTPSTFTATEDFVNVCMYVSHIDTIPQTGVISYPMLTTNLSATYDDFVPYTGDSGSLNGDVADLQKDYGNLKNNPTINKSMTVGTRLDDSVIGDKSFTSGNLAQASGYCSVATGDHPVSLGANSQSLGCYVVARANQCAIGHFNSSSSLASDMSGTRGTAFYVGNGTEHTRSNAFRVDYDGTPYSKAGLNTTGADYAEFFEWEDGNENNEDRRGYFVTLDGKHIKIANEGDWILGIVSGFPAIIGNGDEEWKGRYVFDDFGCPVIEEFEYEEEGYETITNDDGEEEVIIKKVKKTGTKWKEVPEYDPTQPYTGRMQRKEWAAIGMLGVLSVRDDGSCKVNGFCKLADGGIATASDTGYRVVKRVADNIVEVIFK